jgi:hypothetical protein
MDSLQPLAANVADNDACAVGSAHGCIEIAADLGVGGGCLILGGDTKWAEPTGKRAQDNPLGGLGYSAHLAQLFVVALSQGGKDDGESGHHEHGRGVQGYGRGEYSAAVDVEAESGCACDESGSNCKHGASEDSCRRRDDDKERGQINGVRNKGTSQADGPYQQQGYRDLP